MWIQLFLCVTCSKFVLSSIYVSMLVLYISFQCLAARCDVCSVSVYSCILFFSVYIHRGTHIPCDNSCLAASSMSSHVLQMRFFLQISLFYQLELVPSVQPMCRRIRYLWRSRNGTKYILDTLHHMYTFQEGTYMSRLHLRCI